MAKARQLKQLQGMSDEDIRFQHDVASENTVVGIDYFLDELHRREQMRAIKASEELARASVRLAWVSSITSIMALGVAVVTLIVTA